MNKIIQGMAIAGSILLSSVVSAAVSPFSDNLESYTVTDTAALSNASYLVFGFVETHTDPVAHTGTLCTSSDPGGGDYGYGAPAPNDSSSPAFSLLTTGESGANQGNNVVSVISDYNNGDHGAGCQMEHNFFQEQTIDASNVGQTWVFRFDYKNNSTNGNGLTPPSTAQAFIKTIDPTMGFIQTNLVTLDTSGAPDTWTEAVEISLFIDAGLVGQLIQFGFGGTATAFNNSAIYYDNIVWFEAGGGGPSITPFSDNLESYTATDTAALSNAGYLVFGFVETHTDPVAHTGTLCTSSDPGGGDYGYGAPAPNDSSSPAFSLLTTGESGANQGNNVVSVISDYNNGDHGAGCQMEHNFFQEQTIGASNVGQTWVFRFDYKNNSTNGNGLTPPSTAQAFIKTIDPTMGFIQTNLVTLDTSGAPDTWTEAVEISLPIDAGLVGQLIQFGFGGTATAFNNSAIYYDNIEWFQGAAGCVGNGTDTDGDGIDDNCDNCSADANAGQEDADSDGHGNICDGDFDNDCSTAFLDLAAFKAGFFGSDPELDLDSDGTVAFLDLARFKALFFGTPGPSPVGSLCNP